MAYNLYLSSNTITPILVINDGAINQSSTSVGFFGRTLTNYGNIQEQNVLWMLENFANGTAPGEPLVGQLWYDTVQTELKVYQGTSTWRKVSQPQNSATAPTGPSQGQLWYDTVNVVIKVYSGSSWLTVGPTSISSSSYYKQFVSAVTTTNATQTEAWVNGTPNTRMIIPTGTTWTFDMLISSRRTDSGSEYDGWRIVGLINNTAGTVAFAGSPSYTVVGSTSPWNVTVTADNVNGALGLLVTGQTGKTIDWSAVTTIAVAQ